MQQAGKTCQNVNGRLNIMSLEGPDRVTINTESKYFDFIEKDYHTSNGTQNL